jgi:hypothetical protein
MHIASQHAYRKTNHTKMTLPRIFQDDLLLKKKQGGLPRVGVFHQTTERHCLPPT